MRGRSLASVLSGARATVYGPDDFVGGELFNGRWMRQGDLKALLVPPPYGTRKWELYDLAQDPGETRDLAHEQPDTLQKLVTAWDRYADDVGVVLREH